MLLQLQELTFYVSYLSIILSSDLKAPQQYIYVIILLILHFMCAEILFLPWNFRLVKFVKHIKKSLKLDYLW